MQAATHLEPPALPDLLLVSMCLEKQRLVGELIGATMVHNHGPPQTLLGGVPQSVRAAELAWDTEGTLHVGTVHKRQVQRIAEDLVSATDPLVRPHSPVFDGQLQELWPIADDAHGHVGWVVCNRRQDLRCQRGSTIHVHRSVLPPEGGLGLYFQGPSRIKTHQCTRSNF